MFLSEARTASEFQKQACDEIQSRILYYKKRDYTPNSRKEMINIAVLEELTSLMGFLSSVKLPLDVSSYSVLKAAVPL